MSVQLVNRSTLISFIEDRRAFETCVNQRFDLLDLDQDGMLSPQELYEGFDKLMALESTMSEEEKKNTYENIFKKYDEDQNGSIDRQEFRSLVKEIMMGMACSIGDIPLQFALEENSLLMKAVEHELALHD